MNPTAHFSLETHDGPYEEWPLRTRVLIKGKATPASVPGYTLLHQFDTPHGYLLVTDCDCPFEEATSFILLSEDCRVRSCRTLGVAYGSFNLDALTWLDDSHLLAEFYDKDFWMVTIRPWGIPYLRPQIMLRRATESEIAKQAAHD